MLPSMFGIAKGARPGAESRQGRIMPIFGTEKSGRGCFAGVAEWHRWLVEFWHTGGHVLYVRGVWKRIWIGHVCGDGWHAEASFAGRYV